MKNIITALIYLGLFHLSGKVVFAVLGGFEMGQGLFGINWSGVLYTSIISFVAAVPVVIGILTVYNKYTMKSIIVTSLIAIFAYNLYEFTLSTGWFIETWRENTAHALTTSFVFWFVLVATYWCGQKLSINSQNTITPKDRKS